MSDATHTYKVTIYNEKGEAGASTLAEGADKKQVLVDAALQATGSKVSAIEVECPKDGTSEFHKVHKD